MAIFGREILGNTVVDRTGATMGVLTDMHVDLNTGLVSEFLVLRAFHFRSNFHLHVVAFFEICAGVVWIVFCNQVVSGRGGVREHHVRLTA